MRDVISKYIGQQIGVNYDKVDKFEFITLVEVTDERMTLQSPRGTILHFPVRYVMKVIEADSVLGGAFSKKVRVPVLVQVQHFLVPRGGGGGGVGVAVAFD